MAAFGQRLRWFGDVSYMSASERPWLAFLLAQRRESSTGRQWAKTKGLVANKI
jgi:hypothetical protein